MERSWIDQTENIAKINIIKRLEESKTIGKSNEQIIR